MPATKIAISIDSEIVRKIDELVSNARYPSRSKVFQEAVEDKLVRLTRSRLAEQCALLDSAEEQEMADEFSPEELKQWQQA
ncbi:MAG TPA: ribbon-helix-helix domain-containing protein [Pirellulaceae bacterium]